MENPKIQGGVISIPSLMKAMDEEIKSCVTNQALDYCYVTQTFKRRKLTDWLFPIGITKVFTYWMHK